MKVFYDSKYQNLKIKSEEACICVNSNPCANLSSEVSQILNGVRSLNANKIGGSLQANYVQAVTSISNDLSLIISCINSMFAKAEELYLSLDEHLDLLKQFDNEYKKVYNEQDPNKNKKKSSGQGFVFTNLTTTKNNFESNKNRRLKKIEGICIDEQNTIDNIIKSLDAINGMSLSNSSILKVSAIDVKSINFANEDFSSYLKRRVVEKIYEDMSTKINAEKLGFNKEEVISEMMGYSDIGSLILKIENLLEVCPSNFNETLTGIHEFTGNLKKYTFKKSYEELKNERYIDTSIVNIGGNNFEILEVFDKNKMDFFTVLDKRLGRAYVINTLASYPKTFLNTVGIKGSDGSITPIVLDYNIESDVSKGKIGGYFYDDKSTIHVNYNSGTNLHVLNHELGHKFNDYFIDHEKGGKKIDKTYRNELKEIFGEEYLKATYVGGIIPYYYQSYLKEQNYSEMFSECTDAYIRYEDELKIVAPKIHAFFQKIMGDKVISPIKINGTNIPNDTDITESIIWGH